MAKRNRPRFAYISAITNAKDAVVTFTADHDFTVGEIVSFRVTKDFGMDEINKLRSRVSAITNDTITTTIDSTNWTPFSLANLDAPKTTPPVCVPSASGVIFNLYTPTVNIEDAFDIR